MLALATLLACCLGVGHSRRVQSTRQPAQGVDGLTALLVALGDSPAQIGRHWRAAVPTIDTRAIDSDRLWDLRGGFRKRKGAEVNNTALYETLEADLEEALSNLLTSESDSAAKLACVKMVAKIAFNIVDHPSEYGSKYRSIKMDNPVLNKVITDVPFGAECLAAIGFSPAVVDGVNQWVWKENEPVSLKFLQERLLPLLRANIDSEASKRSEELERKMSALQRQESKANVDANAALALAESRLVKQRELEASNAKLRSHLKKARGQTLRKAVARLTAYVPRLLRRRFNRRIFAKDVKVVDQSGRVVQGEDAVRLLRLLRRMRRRFSVKKDELEMTFCIDDPLKPCLVSHWMLQVGGGRSLFRFWRRRTPVNVTAEISFHFNDENLVNYVRIDQWLVNGKALETWPDVQLARRPRSNFKKIKEWVDMARDLRAQ